MKNLIKNLAVFAAGGIVGFVLPAYCIAQKSVYFTDDDVVCDNDEFYVIKAGEPDDKNPDGVHIGIIRYK